jgi:hypothetical protein
VSYQVIQDPDAPLHPPQSDHQGLGGDGAPGARPESLPKCLGGGQARGRPEWGALTGPLDFVRAAAPCDLARLQLDLEGLPFWPLRLLGVEQSHDGAHLEAAAEVQHLGFGGCARPAAVGAGGRDARHAAATSATQAGGPGAAEAEAVAAAGEASGTRWQLLRADAGRGLSAGAGRGEAPPSARREQRRSWGRPPPTAAPAPRNPGQAAAGGPGHLGSAELSPRRPDTTRGTAARHARNPAHRLRPVGPTRARASGPHGTRRGSVHASQGARGLRDPQPSRRTRLPGKAAGRREPRQPGLLTPAVAAGAGPPRTLSGEGRTRGLANRP